MVICGWKNDYASSKENSKFGAKIRMEEGEDYTGDEWSGYRFQGAVIFGRYLGKHVGLCILALNLPGDL